MTRGSVVVAALVLAACSEGATPRPSPSPTPTPVALAGPVIAVIEGRALDLYTVDAAGPRATLLRTLQGPSDARPVSVSVSGGDAPTVCAVWELPSHRQIHCYDAATGAGREVPQQGSEPPDVVAVSHDGTLVAWSTLLRDLPGDESTLYWSPVAGGDLEQIPSRRERLLGLNTCCGSQVEALAWRGDNRLVVSEGREVRRRHRAAGRTGPRARVGGRAGAAAGRRAARAGDLRRRHVAGAGRPDARRAAAERRVL